MATLTLAMTRLYCIIGMLCYVTSQNSVHCTAMFSCYITTFSGLSLLPKVNLIGEQERETHNYQEIQRRLRHRAGFNQVHHYQRARLIVLEGAHCRATIDKRRAAQRTKGRNLSNKDNCLRSTY